MMNYIEIYKQHIVTNLKAERKCWNKLLRKYLTNEYVEKAYTIRIQHLE